MTIATDNIATKADVVNAYNTKLTSITNLINWRASTNPTFSGTAGEYTNPAALPSGQLSNTNPTTLSTSSLSDTILANELYNLIYNAIQTATRIRLTTCKWYFDTNGVDGLIDTQENKYALYNATTSTVTGDTRPFYTKTPNTTSMQGTITLGRNGINQNATIAASNIINILNECYNNWVAFKDSNTVSFNYYTCHSNHSNWGNRGRR